MPSPLFDFLFLVAFFVPIAMYVIGVLMLMASLVATIAGERTVALVHPFRVRWQW